MGRIHLSERSEPQPDLVLLRPRPDFYARAGIAEVWLIALADDAVEVHRGPTAEGYQDVQRVRRGGRLAPQALPDVSVGAAEILG